MAWIVWDAQHFGVPQRRDVYKRQPYYLPSKNADREQTVSLNAGDEVNVTFKNRKMPQLTIYKEDSVAGAPVEGAKFHITYTSSGESAETPATIDYGNILTDAKGEIRLHEQGKRLYPCLLYTSRRGALCR